MKKIKYYTGKKNIEIEVSDSVAGEYHEIRKAEWRQEWLTRQHENKSFEALTNAGVQLAEDGNDPEELYIAQEEQNKKNKLLNGLRKAMTLLSADQQQIVKMKFYEGKNDTDISRELGLSRQAVQNRISKILEKLKKNF